MTVGPQDRDAHAPPGYTSVMPQVIVTAVGPDRPGLVAELTQRVHTA